ncbi:MAG TPA: DUF1614 domain-containing protein [Acetobacteraceae bacterium]|nr:DUF1614 domain-containing protein [Acetobacteraceae bacterium]
MLVAVAEIGALRYAYVRLGVNSRAVLFLLLASLLGSYINIPVAQLPERQIMSGHVIVFYGMRYIVPAVRQWPGTVIAVNVGGAIVPTLLSLYLLARYRLWWRGLLAVAAETALCHYLARPIPGLGIAIPVFVPPVSAAILALVLSPRHAAPLAYVGGSLGTLIGADLLNLGKVQGLGAPVASIGGAGTFDGIFLTGVLAVLVATLAGPPDSRRRRSGSRRGSVPPWPA